MCAAAGQDGEPADGERNVIAGSPAPVVSDVDGGRGTCGPTLGYRCEGRMRFVVGGIMFAASIHHLVKQPWPGSGSPLGEGGFVARRCGNRKRHRGRLPAVWMAAWWSRHARTTVRPVLGWPQLGGGMRELVVMAAL